MANGRRRRVDATVFAVPSSERGMQVLKCDGSIETLMSFDCSTLFSSSSFSFSLMDRCRENKIVRDE